MLKLNGYTVECEPSAGLQTRRDIIKVVGAANTVMGPGTREYTDEKLFFHLITYISDSISHHIIIVKGGSLATGINLSSFGDGFHTVNGVTIGPDRKFTFRK